MNADKRDDNYGKKEDKTEISNPKTEKSVKSSENKCWICKKEITERAVTDPCWHAFCYQCISQSSATSDRCPKCRVIYRKILYHIQSDSVYDERPVSDEKVTAHGFPDTNALNPDIYPYNYMGYPFQNRVNPYPVYRVTRYVDMRDNFTEPHPFPGPLGSVGEKISTIDQKTGLGTAQGTSINSQGSNTANRYPPLPQRIGPEFKVSNPNVVYGLKGTQDVATDNGSTFRDLNTKSETKSAPQLSQPSLPPPFRSAMSKGSDTEQNWPTVETQDLGRVYGGIFLRNSNPRTETQTSSQHSGPDTFGSSLRLSTDTNVDTNRVNSPKYSNTSLSTNSNTRSDPNLNLSVKVQSRSQIPGLNTHSKDSENTASQRSQKIMDQNMVKSKPKAQRRSDRSDGNSGKGLN